MQEGYEGGGGVEHGYVLVDAGSTVSRDAGYGKVMEANPVSRERATPALITARACVWFMKWRWEGVDPQPLVSVRLTA